MWLEEEELLILTDENQVLIGAPCSENVVSLTDLFPNALAHIASYNPDRSQILFAGVQEYWLYTRQQQSVTKVDESLKVDFRNGYSWSPSGRRLAIRSISETQAIFEIKVAVVDVQTGLVIDEFRYEERDFSGGMSGPIWLTDTQLFIESSFDEGPLLFTVEQGTSQVASELFGIPAESGQIATAARLEDTGRYHIAFWHFNPIETTVNLYHSESGEVERLSLPLRPWTALFSPGGDSLLLSTYPTQSGESYEIWQRSIDSRDDVVRPVLATSADHYLFPETTKVAISAGSYITLFTFPEMTVIGSWNLGEYTPLPGPLSPNGEWLALKGHLSGQQREALFVVQLK
jgi:hypothetical protein